METWQTKQLEILMFQKELDVQILRVAFPTTNLHSIHLTNGWIIFLRPYLCWLFGSIFLKLGIARRRGCHQRKTHTAKSTILNNESSLCSTYLGFRLQFRKNFNRARLTISSFFEKEISFKFGAFFSRKHVIPWNLSAAGQLAQSAFVSCRMQKPIFNKHRHYEKSCTADIYRTANAVKMKHESLGVKLGCFRGTRSFLLYMIICTQHVHSIHVYVYIYITHIDCDIVMHGAPHPLIPIYSAQ